MQARVKGFQFAGFSVTLEYLTKDAVAGFDAVKAMPEIEGWQISHVPTLDGLLPSIYFEPPQQYGPSKPPKEIKAKVKARLRGLGFDVVAESKPIGSQVR